MNVPSESHAEKCGDYSAADSAELFAETDDDLPTITLNVPVSLAGERLDRAIARLLPEHSRSRLQTWIRAGRVEADGQSRNEPKWKVLGGETLLIAPEIDPADSPDQPEDIPLTVVYEDDAILILDKRAGLVVHPGSGNRSGTLLNALLHHAPQLGSIPRAGIVHRLDKDTSGLMVVAKTLVAQTDLVRQLQARSVKREYLALAIGELRAGQTIDAPIGRHPTQRTKMAVNGSGGKPARTHVKIVERFAAARCTLVECALDTGRTHQIRVHLASLGHPLVGDPVYAGRSLGNGPAFPRQALHAQRLGLVHPVTGNLCDWTCALPEDLSTLLNALRAG